MEALAEQVIATFLTQGGKVFISPSYNIPLAPGSKSSLWSCPDFVALDFDKHEVVVVEVTAASDAGSIIEKALDREKQWFLPLRTKLHADGIADGWRMRFLGFVRRANLDKAKKALAPAPDVAFAAIEDATFSWDYWNQREGGLPR
jgi:hypothetical protein